jgi:hypothetical protein
VRLLLQRLCVAAHLVVQTAQLFLRFLAPKDLVAHTIHGTILERGLDEAFFPRIGRPICLGVMDRSMIGLANQFLWLTPKHLF